MNEITAQEIFDTVVNGLRQQGCRSEDEAGCVYRGPNNTKCAAGLLIAEAEYDFTMERNTIDELLKMDMCPISLRDRLSPHLVLIKRLQNIHDSETISTWEACFEFIASHFNLVYNKPV